MKTRLILCVLSVICVVNCIPASSQIYTPQTFYRDIALGTWTNVQGLAWSYGTNGVYTNSAAPVTNVYRLTATNSAGRIPHTSNITVVIVGNTNGTTNAVVLRWQHQGGVSGYVMEKSFNLGATFTNLSFIAANTTNWTDTGTNAWSSTALSTSLWSAIPYPTAPWSTTGDVAALQAADVVIQASVTNEAGVRASGDLAGTNYTAGASNTLTILVTNEAADRAAGDATNAAGIAAHTITLATHDSHLTTLDTRATYLENNSLLTWVELQISDSLTRLALADGYRDYFTDQTGINLVKSTNQTWTTGYYSWSKTVALNTNGLARYYQLNDNAASTVVVDYMGLNNATSTPVNTSVMRTTPKVGSGAFLFDATNYVSMSAITTGTLSFSVCMWLRCDNVAAYPIFLQVGTNYQNQGFDIYCRPDLSRGIEIDSYPLSIGWSGISPVNPVNGQWHHFVYTYTNKVGSTQHNMYLDGGAQYTAGDQPNAGLTNSSGWTTLLGYHTWAANQNFRGPIDDFRVYPYVISPTEVSNLWMYGNPVEGGAAGALNLQATNSAVTLMDFTPTQGRLGVWLQTNSGAVSQNANFTGYLSRDASNTNWVQVTFNDSARYSTNQFDVIWWSAMTNLPGTGSNLLWRVNTLGTNTSGRIYGAFPQVL